MAILSGSVAEAWVDELVLEGAQPLAWHEHHFFGRFPSVVSNAYGSGRVTYVGTLPDAGLGCSVARWVLEQAGITPLGAGLPEPVRVTRALSPNGDRLSFVSNCSSEPVCVPSPTAGTRLFDGTPIGRGDALELEPWDIVVLAEPCA